MGLFGKTINKHLGKMPKCSAVIVAAGSSQRMGGDDKLYIELLGVPVLAHALTVFQRCACITEIIVVAREDSLQRAADICERYAITKCTEVIAGGETRFDSVMNGVFASSPKAGLIAIHDGARPCVDTDIIERTAELAAKRHAAAPAVPVGNTLKKVSGGVILETVDRGDLVEMQTPQVFTQELIKAALTNAKKKALTVTDDCQTVEALGAPVYITGGSHNNIKLTTAEDTAIAEAIISKNTDYCHPERSDGSRASP